MTVLRAGIMSTIQDLGRPGFQTYGVTVGGVLDPIAARIANMLVGNEESEAVLELTLGGAEFRIERNVWIALCGADMQPLVNGDHPLPLWRPILLPAGATIRFGSCISGSRAYMAIAGGYRINKVMGSRSTYVKGGYGGFNGRALVAGDRIELGGTDSEGERVPGWDWEEPPIDAGVECGAAKTVPWHAGAFAAMQSHPVVVRVLEGVHYKFLSEESKQSLHERSFLVGTQSDRMGCRLQGEIKLELADLAMQGQLLSEAVSHGTVQLPPDGHPIVLLADRGTTGGYPRIAHATTVDRGVVAQLKPGDRVRFQFIEVWEAELLLLQAEKDMAIVKEAIRLKLTR
ncbi:MULTISPECIES: 5-oxoprolinase subunit C family protein [unclassified Paenibacillus]|uniref:5-oxoprolinase subunit C family protein n=1 Tax=unclassified Paenibacillus TaxID=185978 RepID=UPI0036D219B5